MRSRGPRAHGRSALPDRRRCLVDANVVAELMRPVPDARVLEFMDRLDVASLAIASVTAWEILNGLGRMPECRRRRDLADRYRMFEEAPFGDRILPWTREDARTCAEILEIRRRVERPLDGQLPDAFLAAAAVSRDLTIITRNTCDFEATGARTVDPWSEDIAAMPGGRAGP